MLRKTLLALLITLVLLNMVGCSYMPLTQPVDKDELEKSNDTNNPTQPLVEYNILLKLDNGLITDSKILEKLWQEYIYDSIATVLNTGNFNKPEDIDVLGVMLFCARRYISENDFENLEFAHEGSSLRLLPLDVVETYSQKYFEITNIDLTKLSNMEHYYDAEKKAIRLSMGREINRPNYNGRNSFGIQIDKVHMNQDKTLDIFLSQVDSYQTQRITKTHILTLKQREDGSYHFLRGRMEYINNNLVTITGDFERFDNIIGYTDPLEEVTMVGEVSEGIILSHTPYREGTNSLLLVDPSSMTVIKNLLLSFKVYSENIRMGYGEILMLLEDRIVIVSDDFESMKTIEIPGIITEKTSRVPKYDDNGFPDVFFGGYDISPDRIMFIYSDEEGLKLINTVAKKETLLAKTEVIKGSQLIDRSYHFAPRFIDNGNKVISTMSGYESTMGYTLINIKDNSQEKINISSETSTTGDIRYDNGILEVNAYVKYENNKDIYGTYFINFKNEFNGIIEEIILTNPGDTKFIRFPYDCYIGLNYGVFNTYKWNNQDYTKTKVFINRMDLKTLSVEEHLISITATQPNILGVLKDGRIIFWYFLNPTEKGICITK